MRADWLDDETIPVFYAALCGEPFGMPQVRVRYQTASVYEAAAIETEKRAIRSTYGMVVIGILDDTWYHVWFPLTGETGYVLQWELI